ncbi:hypothetical protein QBE52_02970 [Clostridiaceae bacterium 35-E11]
MRKLMFILVVVLAIGAGGWYYWNSIDITDVDPQTEVVEGEEVTDSLEDPTQEEKIEDQVVGSDQEEVQEQGEAPIKVVDSLDKPLESQPQVQPNASKNQQNGSATPKPSPKPLTPKELERQIIAKYTEKLTNLKNKYQGKLNALIAEAKAEYHGLSEEDRKKSKLSLGLKYLKKGKKLEESCDNEFDGIVEQMKQELKKNNLSQDSVKRARDQYAEEKSARRKYLLEKALNKG